MNKKNKLLKECRRENAFVGMTQIWERKALRKSDGARMQYNVIVLVELSFFF